MPKTYRYKKPRLSTYSPVPAIYGMREYVNTMNTLTRDFPKRIDRGRKLFLLAMAEIVRDYVKRNAPDIKIGNEMFPYAEHLKIGIVSGVDDEDAVAIYFENKTLKLSMENMGGKVLYFQAVRGSQPWVNVLMVYGPWPSGMIPVQKKDLKARVITRNARDDEIGALSRRIYNNRNRIEMDFARSGLTGVKIGKTQNAIGIVVNEDIGYNILRTEFGYGDTRQVAHWRPALRTMNDSIPILMRKYLRYLQTGKESVFGLSGDRIWDVNVNDLNRVSKFAATLAPFVPKG